jgi:hypothetical protein
MVLGGALALTTLLARPSAPTASAQESDDQHVLGPGLYVFQTRTRSASCGDDERTGYVDSFVAPIHGIPGSRSMRMELPNNAYWRDWSITVSADGAVAGDAFLVGSAGPSRPTSHFVVRVDGEQLEGEGTRVYDAQIGGETRRCVVSYDALLRRIDL